MRVLPLSESLVSITCVKWSVSKEIQVKQGYVWAYPLKKMWPESSWNPAVCSPGTMVLYSDPLAVCNGFIAHSSCWEWELNTAQVARSVTVTDATKVPRWCFDAHWERGGHFSSAFTQMLSWKAEEISQRTQAPSRATFLRGEGQLSQSVKCIVETALTLWHEPRH